MSVVGHRADTPSSVEPASTSTANGPQTSGRPWWSRMIAAGRRHPSLLWGAATPLVVLVAACLPLLVTRDFYFWDDTEIGGFPLWFDLGEKLRAGEWPILEPSRWMGGNIVAEGQWGLWNPMMLAVSLAASFAGNALTFTTGVKLLFFMVAALGVFLLARSYDVQPPLAFAAGVAVPLNGFTLYMDAPSWAVGMITWSLLPYAWAALRHSTAKGSHPAAFLVAAYLLVTTGYFHGTLALCLVLLSVGIDRLWARDWRGVRCAGLGAAFVGLISVTLYLPSLLTTDVTVRTQEEVINFGTFNADLGGLLSSGIPTAMFAVGGWWGDFTTTPLLYTAWFLPALAFVPWTLVRPRLREMRDLLIVLLGATLVVMGPSEAGALRFPVRFMPYVALAGIVALIILLDRGLSVSAARSGSALALAIGVVSVGSVISWSERPAVGDILLWTIPFLFVGLLLVWLLLRREGLPSPAATAALALVLAAGSVISVGAQTQVYPESPSDHYDMPGPLADYKRALPAAVNDVVVIGDPGGVFDVTTFSRHFDTRPPPGGVSQLWDETLIANTWLLNDASVLNVYSIIQHQGFVNTMCTNYSGDTCRALLQRLFEPQAGLGVQLVDLISVDTVHILKGNVPPFERRQPPDGWSVASDGEDTVTWTRDEPVGPAGGVVWTGPGTSVTELERTKRTVRLQVDNVPAEGGRAVFSRLNWPGYTVTGATVADPVNDFLLSVDIPASSEGGTVELSFSPPGWSTAIATWVLALVLGVGWSLAHVALSRRRRGAARDRPGRDQPADSAPLESVPAPIG